MVWLSMPGTYRVYRHLLEHGRQPGVPAPRRYPPEVYKRIDKLQAKRMKWSDIAAQLRTEYPEACADVTRNVCSAIWRRAQESSPGVDVAKPGLSPRTVRYVHNILHSALKDARCVGTGSCETSPTPPLPRPRHRPARHGPRHGQRRSC